jgi:hypothetical protein
MSSYFVFYIVCNNLFPLLVCSDPGKKLSISNNFAFLRSFGNVNSLFALAVLLSLPCYRFPTTQPRHTDTDVGYEETYLDCQAMQTVNDRAGGGGSVRARLSILNRPRYFFLSGNQPTAESED